MLSRTHPCWHRAKLCWNRGKPCLSRGKPCWNRGEPSWKGAVPCWTVSQTLSSGANRVGSGVIRSCTMIIRGVARVKKWLTVRHGSTQTTPLLLRSHYGPPRINYGSTRFWRSSQFTPVVFDMSKTAGAAHGSSRTTQTSLRFDHRFTQVHEPGALWDCSFILQPLVIINNAYDIQPKTILPPMKSPHQCLILQPLVIIMYMTYSLWLSYLPWSLHITGLINNYIT